MTGEVGGGVTGMEAGGWREEGGDSGTDSRHMEPVWLTKSWCHVCSISALSLSVPACPDFSPRGSSGHL